MHSIKWNFYFTWKDLKFYWRINVTISEEYLAVFIWNVYVGASYLGFLQELKDLLNNFKIHKL